MRALARSLFLLAAVGVFLLGPGQPVKAGDGGTDLGTLQASIGDANGDYGLCYYLGIGPGSSYLGFEGPLTLSLCPQLPTISQAVLETAALLDTPLEAVRGFGSVPMGGNIDAANPSRPPAAPALPELVGSTGLADPGVLASLTPLAFIAPNNGNGPATPTTLSNPTANTFVYAVAGSLTGTQPDTLFLFYEDIGRDNQTFQSTQVVAKFSLPLTMLNSSNSTETAVPAILQYTAVNNPPNKNQQNCSASTLIDPTGATAHWGAGTTTSPGTLATNVGINCAVVFTATPLSSHPHAVFEVAVRLLITDATDPAYLDDTDFYDALLSYSSPVFTSDDDGYMTSATSAIGIAPSAAPLGSPPTCTTKNNVTTCTPPLTYALCAKLPTNGNGPGAPPVYAAAAFYAIATDGETLLSAPLAPGVPIGCPAGM